LVSQELGGAALVALNFAKWLERTGARARIWIPGEGPAAQATERNELAWERYDLAALRQGPLAHLGACLRLAPKLWWKRGVAFFQSPVLYRMLSPVLRMAGLRT